MRLLALTKLARAFSADSRNISTIKYVGQLSDQLKILHGLLNRDSEDVKGATQEAFTTAIHFAAEAADGGTATLLLQGMLEEGITPPLECHAGAIRALARSRKRPEALELFSALEEPDAACYAAAIRAWAERSPSPKAAMALLRRMQEKGVAPDAECYSNVMHVHARAKEQKDALDLLQEMRERMPPTSRAYHSCMSACVRASDAEGALALLEQMVADGITPSNITVNTLLVPLTYMGEVAAVARVFGLAATHGSTGSKLGDRVWQAAVDLYSGIGDVKTALAILRVSQAYAVDATFAMRTSGCTSLSSEPAATASEISEEQEELEVGEEEDTEAAAKPPNSSMLNSPPPKLSSAAQRRIETVKATDAAAELKDSPALAVLAAVAGAQAPWSARESHRYGSVLQACIKDMDGRGRRVGDALLSEMMGAKVKAPDSIFEAYKAARAAQKRGESPPPDQELAEKREAAAAAWQEVATAVKAASPLPPTSFAGKTAVELAAAAADAAAEETAAPAWEDIMPPLPPTRSRRKATAAASVKRPSPRSAPRSARKEGGSRPQGSRQQRSEAAGKAAAGSDAET